MTMTIPVTMTVEGSFTTVKSSCENAYVVSTNKGEIRTNNQNERINLLTHVNFCTTLINTQQFVELSLQCIEDFLVIFQKSHSTVLSLKLRSVVQAIEFDWTLILWVSYFYGWNNGKACRFQTMLHALETISNNKNFELNSRKGDSITTTVYPSGDRNKVNVKWEDDPWVASFDTTVIGLRD